MGQRKLFCQQNRLFYHISLRKEYLLRDIRFLCSGQRYAHAKKNEALPHVVKSHRSMALRELPGVDMSLQHNKMTNLRLAAGKINGLVISPGEAFSFWKTVGPVTGKKGYLEGLTISGGKVTKGIGGGLCQLANMIHWLVLNSPLTVTELHHHTDALFPDAQRRVPFGTGTSVFYKNVDYQFKNATDQPVQLLLWLEGADLCGELRSLHPYPCRYKITEEDSRFVKEGEQYFRRSRVYRLVTDRQTETVLARELILENRSRVLYDYSLIPPEQVREE